MPTSRSPKPIPGIGAVHLPALALGAAVVLAFADHADAAAPRGCVHPAVSERLGNRCLVRGLSGRAVPVEEAQFIDSRLKFEGYQDGLGIGFPQRVRRGTASAAISPVYEWSPNINGGDPPGCPTIAGLTCVSLSPERERKEGMVLGARPSFNGRFRYGGGRFLQYGAGAQYTRSFEHGLGIRTANGSACTSNRVRGDWYADSCLRSFFSEKELDDGNVVSTFDLGVSRILGGKNGVESSIHELSLNGSRLIRKDDHAQNSFDVGLDSVFRRGLSTGFSVKYGELVEGELVTRLTLTSTVGFRVWRQKPVTLSGSLSLAEGARFLGRKRDETSTAIFLSYPITVLKRPLSLSVGYRTTDSSEIDYFDSSEFLANFNLPAFTF